MPEANELWTIIVGDDAAQLITLVMVDEDGEMNHFCMDQEQTVQLIADLQNRLRNS